MQTIELHDGQVVRRRLGRAFLRVEEGSDEGKEVAVDGTRVTGGRSAVNDLQLRISEHRERGDRSIVNTKIGPS